MDLSMNKKGFMSNMVNVIIAVTVGLIVLISVAIPVVDDSIDDGNYTGTLGTVLDNVPIFMGIGALIAATAIFTLFRR